MPNVCTIRSSWAKLLKTALMTTFGVALACLCGPEISIADDNDATLYELTAELKIPQLGQDPGYNMAHEKRCLTLWQLHQIFPILLHPALARCHLGVESRQVDKLKYPLECDSEHGTTGMVEWETRGRDVIGRLYAQSASSKTAFSQRVVARPIEACFPHASYL
jgi:hypothetical protein